MANPCSEEEKQEALRIYQTDGLAAATNQTGWSRTAIKRWAAKAGITSGAADTMAAAHEARRINAAKLRADFSAKSIALADRLIDMLSDDLDRDPTALGAKDKAVILGIVADKHRVVASMDKATQSHSDVDQWLEHITGMPTE